MTDMEYLIKKAFEDGYQKGLYDGIIEASRNAAKPTPRRIVATGNENGFTAVHPDYEEDYAILSGPMSEQEQAQ